MRKDFTIAMSLVGSAVDDPDTQFYENYSCRSSRNYIGCNPEVDALIEHSSRRKPGWVAARQPGPVCLRSR
jgi:peptide/nickel transport system substrate-binding protein